MKRKTKLKKGITLIETTIYLALMATAFVSIANFGIVIAGYNQVAKASNDIQQTMIFLNQHLDEHIDLADSIDVINSVFDSSNGSLVLTDDTETWTYQITNGNLVFDVNGTSSQLTPIDASVTDFTIERVDFGNPEIYALRITLILQFNKNNTTIEQFTNVYSLE